MRLRQANICAALRVIGTDISPALGYFDTPKLDLTKVTPLAGAPTPIPAGRIGGQSTSHLHFLFEKTPGNEWI